MSFRLGAIRPVFLPRSPDNGPIDLWLIGYEMWAACSIRQPLRSLPMFWVVLGSASTCVVIGCGPWTWRICLWILSPVPWEDA